MKSKWGIMLLAGVIYYILIRYTSFGVPCLFYKVFHLKCPGCGITRMIYQLSLFHWQKAMQANYFLFWTSPVLIVFVLHEVLKKQRKGKYTAVWKWVGIGYLVSLMIWMAVRNLMQV